MVESAQKSFQPLSQPNQVALNPPPAKSSRFLLGFLVILAFLVLVAVVVYGQMQLKKKSSGQTITSYQEVVKSIPIVPPRPATGSSVNESTKSPLLP